METVTRRAGFDSWRRCSWRWLATLAVVSSTGCATVLNSGPKPVGFDSDPAGADAVGGMCFRGRPPPDCNSFWITEIGYSALVTSDDNRQEGSHYVSGELGLMFNSGEHYAYGFTAFVGGLGGTGSLGSAMRGGLRARVRRWLSAGTAVDLSAGPMYTGTGKMGFSSQVGLSFSDKFLLVAQLEHVSKVRYRKSRARPVPPMCTWGSDSDRSLQPSRCWPPVCS